MMFICCMHWRFSSFGKDSVEERATDAGVSQSSNAGTAQDTWPKKKAHEVPPLPNISGRSAAGEIHVLAELQTRHVLTQVCTEHVTTLERPSVWAVQTQPSGAGYRPRANVERRTQSILLLSPFWVKQLPKPRGYSLPTHSFSNPKFQGITDKAQNISAQRDHWHN